MSVRRAAAVLAIAVAAVLGTGSVAWAQSDPPPESTDPVGYEPPEFFIEGTPAATGPGLGTSASVPVDITPTAGTTTDPTETLRWLALVATVSAGALSVMRDVYATDRG